MCIDTHVGYQSRLRDLGDVLGGDPQEAVVVRVVRIGLEKRSATRTESAVKEELDAPNRKHVIAVVFDPLFLEVLGDLFGAAFERAASCAPSMA